MKTYPTYKPSNVAWLGDVPNHWELKRIASFFTERRQKVSDKDYPPLSVTKLGIFPQWENVAKSNDGDNRKLVKQGDFVINSRSDRKGSSGLAKQDGSVSLINIVLEPIDIHAQFVEYLFKSNNFIEEFYRVGHGIVADLWTTRFDDIKNSLVAIPPLSEQTAIADYLDSKTAQIATAIALKSEQIAKLKEYRQTLINDTVTKGLNPNATLKNSGVAWLGDVPEHWEISKLGRMLKPFSEKNHADLPLLSITRELGVIERDVENQDENHNFIPDDLSGYKLLKKGQFGMNKMKAWQGSYGVSPFTGIVSPAYFIFDFVQEINPNFFHWAIRSKLYISFFGSASDGVRIGQWDLSKSRMKNIPFVIPPLSEQTAIADYLDSKTAQIDTAINQYQAQMERLKEYQERLISDVVTGKIRVD